MKLQWATFQDASDQSSLSRIWGGIHPPVDDVAGRKIGIKVAQRAVERAASFFKGNRACESERCGDSHRSTRMLPRSADGRHGSNLGEMIDFVNGGLGFIGRPGLLAK